MFSVDFASGLVGTPLYDFVSVLLAADSSGFALVSLVVSESSFAMAVLTFLSLLVTVDVGRFVFALTTFASSDSAPLVVKASIFAIVAFVTVLSLDNFFICLTLLLSYWFGALVSDYCFEYLILLH